MENGENTGSSALSLAVTSPNSTMHLGFLLRLETPSNCRRCDGELPPGNLYMCAQCDATIAEETRAAEERDRRKELSDRMRRAEVSDDFALEKKGFHNFDVSLSEHHATAARAAESWTSRGNLDSAGLLLFGPNGTGKSHLAESAIAAVVRDGRAARFVTVRSLVLDVRAAYSFEESERDRLEPYIRVPFLALDDFGQGRVTQHVVDTLFSLIDARLRARRRTLITTNFGLRDLAERLAAGRECDPLDAKRIVDRLAELCAVRIEIGGSSHRGREKQRSSFQRSAESRPHDATRRGRTEKISESMAAPARLSAAK